MLFHNFLDFFTKNIKPSPPPYTHKCIFILGHDYIVQKVRIVTESRFSMGLRFYSVSLLRLSWTSFFGAISKREPVCISILNILNAFALCLMPPPWCVGSTHRPLPSIFGSTTSWWISCWLQRMLGLFVDLHFLDPSTSSDWFCFLVIFCTKSTCTL